MSKCRGLILEEVAGLKGAPNCAHQGCYGSQCWEGSIACLPREHTRTPAGITARSLPCRKKQSFGDGWDGIGMSVERAYPAKDPIFEQTAILGALLSLQGLWIFHEVTTWASHSLGPPRCWLLHWWNKAPIHWVWRFSVLTACTSLSDWGGEGWRKNPAAWKLSQ